MNKKSCFSILKPTVLYSEADRRRKEILDCKRVMESELRKAPPGIMHVVHSGTRIQYYLRSDRSDKSGKYIRKSDKQTIGTLLRKAYYEKVIKLLNEELGNLDLLLKKSNDTVEKIRKLYSDLPREMKQYIDPVDKLDADIIDEWLNIPYDGKEIPEHIPIYITERGERVRSKSELNIANKLAEKNIPYKYECPLTLAGGKVIFPDFTVLNIKERREIYWEHRGMMDDREYSRQAVFKMKSMMNSDIILGNNLIITEETSVNPLGTNEIDSIIASFF